MTNWISMRESRRGEVDGHFGVLETGRRRGMPLQLPGPDAFSRILEATGWPVIFWAHRSFREPWRAWGHAGRPTAIPPPCFGNEMLNWTEIEAAWTCAYSTGMAAIPLSHQKQGVVALKRQPSSHVHRQALENQSPGFRVRRVFLDASRSVEPAGPGGARALAEVDLYGCPGPCGTDSRSRRDFSQQRT